MRRATDGITDRCWVWDGDNLLLEADGAFTVQSQYVHAGIDQPVVTRTGPIVIPGLPDVIYLSRMPQQDALGNVIGTLSPSQTTVDLVQYDTWGSPTIVSSDTATRLLWKGTLWEANEVVGPTGLYYMRARWYDPALGRFLSEDPLGVDGGMNRYVFAGNDPINGADPSGLRGTTGAALGWGAMSAEGWIAAGPDHPEEVSAFAERAFAERGVSFWGWEPWESEATCRDIAWRMVESHVEDYWPWRINPVLYAHACDQYYPWIADYDLYDWAQDLDPWGYWDWIDDFMWDFPRYGFDDPLDMLSLCTDAQAAYNNGMIRESLTKEWACWVEESVWIEPQVLAPYKTTASASSSWWDNLHIGLDMVGMVPGMEWADLANAGFYAIQGDAVNAGISLAAAVPLVGTAVTAAKAAKAGAKYTKSSLRLGREMHLAYKAGDVVEGIAMKEFRGVPGIRPDFVDFSTKTIYELKPFNPRAMQQGRNQLSKYQNLFQQKYGGAWKTVLDTY